MTTPVVYGGLGIAAHGLGRLGLGGPQPVQSFALPAMSKVALPYIAHLYDHNCVFKRTLGGVGVTGTLLNKPGLKMTQNGGYQAITLEVSSPVTGIVLGDVIRLTEQGDNASTILFSGNVETTPSELAVGAGATHHLITVTPWVAELGDGYFNQNYTVATDVAQFVRDAVAATAHCSVSPISCPNTGIKAIYNFQSTNPLDAIHVARQVAGSQWWWFCNAQGVVGFQPVTTANPPSITLKRIDYSRIKPVASVAAMRNKIELYGGSLPGDPTRLQANYDGVTNQGLYGVRAFNPTLSYPQITDQATLNAIVATLGAHYDRVLTTVEMTCPALGVRLSPGLTVRYWGPAVESLQESATGGGGYSATYVLQDIEIDGPSQKLVFGDVPYADSDSAYEAARIAQRMAVVSATAVPLPALVPAPAPATTTTYGAVSASTGIFAAGGGVVTIATATFTTPKAGTCQVIGAVDARMEAWNDYVATPRRAVRATLSGGIFTGAWQELPFGLDRKTYDLSSASGLVLAAGTYTVVIQIETEATNQMHIYSGYVQVAVIA